MITITCNSDFEMFFIPSFSSIFYLENLTHDVTKRIFISNNLVCRHLWTIPIANIATRPRMQPIAINEVDL